MIISSLVALSVLLTATPSASPSVSDSLKSRIEESTLTKSEYVDQILETSKTRLAARKEDFLEKVETLKDERKKITLQRLVGKFDSINTKWVNAWKKKLEKLSEILIKLDKIENELETSGVDTSSYMDKRNLAGSKIDEAYKLLEEQAANSYVFDITSESRVGSEVDNVTGQFKEDVKNTHDSVKVARDAVREALAVIKVLKGSKSE